MIILQAGLQTWDLMKGFHCFMLDYNSLRGKCPDTEFCLVRIFLHSDLIGRDTPYLSVFSPNAGKCGPEKTLYFDTFHAVIDLAIRRIVAHESSYISYCLVGSWLTYFGSKYFILLFYKCIEAFLNWCLKRPIIHSSWLAFVFFLCNILVVTFTIIVTAMLWPLLFNIFMSDMLRTLKTIYFTDYADDNTPFAVRDNITDLVKALQEIGENFVNWFSNNEMKLNTDKCHLLLTLSWRRPLSYIETSPLICRANQWTCFYIITASVLKELNSEEPNTLKIGDLRIS